MDTIKFNPRNGQATTIEGTWQGRIFVPTTLALQAPNWMPHLQKFAAVFPDQLFLLSSVVTGLFGNERTEPNSSHARGLSADLAPIASKEACFAPNSQSPRLCDKRPVLAASAFAIKGLPFGVVAEGDHFHFDKRLTPAAYAYSTYRKDYANDAENALHPFEPLVRKLMVCADDGSISVANASVLTGSPARRKAKRAARLEKRAVKRPNKAAKNATRLEGLYAKFPQLKPAQQEAPITEAPRRISASSIPQLRSTNPPLFSRPDFEMPQTEIADDDIMMETAGAYVPEIEIQDQAGTWVSDPVFTVDAEIEDYEY